MAAHAVLQEPINPQTDDGRVDLERAEHILVSENARLQERLQNIAARSSSMQALLLQARQELEQVGELHLDNYPTLATLKTVDVLVPDFDALQAARRKAHLESIKMRLQANQVLETQILYQEKRCDELQKMLLNGQKEMQRYASVKQVLQKDISAEPPAIPADLKEAAHTTLTNRRTQPRVPLSVAIHFDSDDNFYSGLTVDLSQSGIFVATVHLQPIGSVIDLTFSLPNGQTIQALGEVRWIREYNPRTPRLMPGMGIAFKNMEPQAASYVLAFMQQREPLLYA